MMYIKTVSFIMSTLWLSQLLTDRKSTLQSPKSHFQKTPQVTNSSPVYFIISMISRYQYIMQIITYVLKLYNFFILFIFCSPISMNCIKVSVYNFSWESCKFHCCTCSIKWLSCISSSALYWSWWSDKWT